jgi:mRNA interferase RelE/StbE
MLGEHLGNMFNINLTGFYKLYADNKRIRIVYKLIGEEIEIIEIWGIGKREKEEIYRLMGHRLKKKSK